MKNLLTVLIIVISSTYANSQMLVFDAAATGLLTLNHTEQKSILNKIHSEEKEIKSYQAIITIKTEELRSLQSKVVNYLSTVQGVVHTGKDIIYASDIIKQIKIYQEKALEFAKNDPKLLAIVIKTEAQLVQRSVSLVTEIYSFALVGGFENMLDTKQRIDFIHHVIRELQTMRGLAYGVYRQIRYASQGNFLKILLKKQIQWVDQRQRTMNTIIKDVKWIKNKL